MNHPPFHLTEPEQRLSSVIFASPHSARTYPADFLEQSILDPVTIRSSEDAFVHELIESAPEFGAPLLVAGVPRAYVDLNRSPDELDPALILGAVRRGQNPRVASGLGVIPRVVSNGRAIYAGKLTMGEVRSRIDRYWRPYHNAVQRLLESAYLTFGQAILVDCHSMPHEAMDGAARSRGRAPDIVLGDRFGAAADGDIVDRIEAAFAAAGLRVARNAPFAGAYVAQAYGRPSRQQHAVQIEIDRALYMNERQICPSADFEAFRTLMRGVIAEITAIGQDRIPLAAE